MTVSRFLVFSILSLISPRNPRPKARQTENTHTTQCSTPCEEDGDGDGGPPRGGVYHGNWANGKRDGEGSFTQEVKHTLL